MLNNRLSASNCFIFIHIHLHGVTYTEFMPLSKFYQLCIFLGGVLLYTCVIVCWIALKIPKILPLIFLYCNFFILFIFYYFLFYKLSPIICGQSPGDETLAGAQCYMSVRQTLSLISWL